MPIGAIMATLRALGIWLVLAIVFAGAVVTGWVHGPWNYYWFFAMGCWLVLDAYWALGAYTTKPIIPAKQFRSAVVSSAVVHALYCLPLSSVPVLGQSILPHWVCLKMLGAVLCAVGVGFAIWARRVLARNWNAAVGLQEKHALVCVGPYAMVRHPIYLGFLLMALGMFLALGEVRGLAGICHVTQFFGKMKAEEEILRATYPTAYADYERKVKRLVPYIW